MCLTSIISWHLDIMDQSQCWVFFLVNDVMESEGCAQRMTLTRNLISVIILASVRASLGEGEIYWDSKGSHFIVIVPF